MTSEEQLAWSYCEARDRMERCRQGILPGGVILQERTEGMKGELLPGMTDAELARHVALCKATITVAFRALGESDSVLALSLRQQYADTLEVLRKGLVEDVDWDEVSDLLDALTAGLKEKE